MAGAGGATAEIVGGRDRVSARPAARWPVLCGILLLAAMCGWLLLPPLRALFAYVPVNYDEGWNAVHAARLMAGGPLYPPVAGGTTINYPPLSFYVVGALGRLLDDYIFAGRLVALLAQAVVAINAALLARRIGATPLFATAAALLFVLFTEIHSPDYVGMNDPQWLGHALQSAALVLLARGDLNSWGLPPLAGAALLLLLGGLVKQSLIAAPLAATIWIAWQQRAVLGRWLAVCVAGLAIAAVIFYLVYGPDFFDQVVANPRSFSTTFLLWMWHNVVPYLLPYALFGLGGLALGWSDARTRLIDVYLPVSAAVALVLMCADGVNFNALFDFLIAVMPACALLGSRISAMSGFTVKGRNLSSLLGTAVLLLPVAFVATHALDRDEDLIDRLARQPEWRQVIDAIARADGPVACKQLSLCYWAGRQSQIEFFNFGQRAIRSPQLAADEADLLRRRGLALIQIDAAAGDPMLPAAVNEALSHNYTQVVRSEPTLLLAPAPPADGR